MPTKQFNPYLNLDHALESWRRDHVQGRKQVLTREGGSSGSPERGEAVVPLNEFSNSSLQLFSAAQDLQRTLLYHVRRRLEALEAKFSGSGMPPSDACTAHTSEASRIPKDFTDLFRTQIAEFIAAKSQFWEESDQPSPDEIDVYAKKFEAEAVGLFDDSTSDFKLKTWGHSQSPVQEASDAAHERASQRRMFLDPILDEKGWSPGQLADKAGLDRHVIQHYMDGTTARPRRSTRKQIADALDIDVKKIPS